MPAPGTHAASSPSRLLPAYVVPASLYVEEPFTLLRPCACACVEFRFFSSFSELDYARAGNSVSESVTIAPEEFESEYGMPHTMLEPLKKLGMPVQLNKGVLQLERPFTICEAGDVLTPEQGRLLVRGGFCSLHALCEGSWFAHRARAGASVPE